ncbi:MAG TPA: fused MFS/spermidine synthase [Candidatus Udaeobacter sp.]|nr:fused MFS/spermidine synthase [Candidatus Udaeobacter sp.]
MRVAVLCGVLFLSGIGALIFETLWLRLSGLAFGNSVWAAALILSSFMGGLALGSAIAASSRIRRWRPLHLYALLELFVALFGCTIVFGLPVLGELMRPVWQTLWNYQPTLLGLRFIVSFLILLVPTTAMGLTLPVLIEDPVLRQTNFARAIGFLYGFNTLGAVAGAVLGEGYLIAAFGLRGTSLAAGLAVCMAAAVALIVAKREGESGTNVLQRTFPLRLSVTYRPPWRLLFVSFGTGCILLALEVIWFRFLRLYVASSPTAFAVMLAVVLAGIGAGAILGGAIHRSEAQPNHLLPALLLSTAILVLLSYLFFPGELFPAPTGVFELRWWQIALLSIALMFPVSLLSGILFPSIVANVQARVEDRMKSTGIATLFNTAGAAVGPLAASIVLLPAIGYQWSLIFCAAGYALLSILVTDRADWSIRRPIGLVTIALCATVVLLLAFFPYQRVESHFAHASRPYEMDKHGHVLEHVVKRIEGTSDTWQLLRRDLFGEPYYYRLLTNAFSMSATNPYSQRYMRLFAYLPLAFRQESEDVLLISYGCGVTADAFLHGSHVKRMDVVDISKEVFALADFYSGINYSNPLRDPRTHAVVQDGRFFLQASPRQYDIISGEPPPPKVAGSVNLYTHQFFSLMNSRLKEGGIATFWLPINQLKVEETKAILRAFHDAFSNSSVWAGADQDWIMMGIKGPGRKVPEEEIRQLWSHPDSGGDLRRIGIEVPQQLGALFLMDSQEIDRITRDVSPLTDNYPKRLSDAAWDDEASQRFAFTYMEALPALQRFLHSPLVAAVWPETLNSSMESFFVIRESRYLSETVGSNKLAELDLYLRHSGLRIPVLEVLKSDGFRLAIAERVAKRSQAPPLEIMADLIAGALARRDVNAAIRLLEGERDRGALSPNDTFLLTYLYCLNGSVDKAEALAGTNANSIKKDWFVDWLWGKLENDFGFHPPP